MGIFLTCLSTFIKSVIFDFVEITDGKALEQASQTEIFQRR